MVVYSEILNFIENSKTTTCSYHKTIPVPYALVADDAFPLTRHTMKPYATDLNKGSPKRVFNYRLSRARRIVENAFWLLVSLFRIFRKPI